MYNREYTPERITELKPNEIFVFGSNLAGAHGGGAARLAYNRFGAVWGQGVGLQGQSYAIPTMQGGVETIMPYVDEFIRFAMTRPDLKFYVTQIGCGIAGFKVEEIAPLFAQAYYADNIILPEDFVEELRNVILLPKTWDGGEFVFAQEDIAKMESLSTAIDSIEFRNTLIRENRFHLKDQWAIMPSGKFIRRGNTLVGFEPANDNIICRWTKPVLSKEYEITLKRLIFPGEEITAIAEGMFEKIEVVGMVALPWELEEMGDYVFAKSKIGILKIYPDALKSQYGRQFKGATIDKLFLPESSLPMSCSELGLLRSIVVNASVKEVILDESVHMSWEDFVKQV